jgi:hypothetical protein
MNQILQTETLWHDTTQLEINAANIFLEIMPWLNIPTDVYFQNKEPSIPNVGGIQICLTDRVSMSISVSNGKGTFCFIPEGPRIIETFSESDPNELIGAASNLIQKIRATKWGQTPIFETRKLLAPVWVDFECVSANMPQQIPEKIFVAAGTLTTWAPSHLCWAFTPKDPDNDLWVWSHKIYGQMVFDSMLLKRKTPKLPESFDDFVGLSLKGKMQ